MRFARLPKEFVEVHTTSANLEGLSKAKPEVVARHRRLALISLGVLVAAHFAYTTLFAGSFLAIVSLAAILAVIFAWDNLVYVVFQLNFANGRFRNFYVVVYGFGILAIIAGISGQTNTSLLFLVLMSIPTLVTLFLALKDAKKSYRIEHATAYMIKKYKEDRKKTQRPDQTHQ